jgi:hypothetical protein
VVIVKHCGYTAVVQVPVGTELITASVAQQEIHIEDQPEGGSNALNVNRLVVGTLIVYKYILMLYFTIRKHDISVHLIDLK